MIIRYALFEGTVKPGKTKEFREAVLTSILPRWKQMPGALAIRVTFADARDEDAPEYPLILAISYPDMATVDAALASPYRLYAKAATDEVLSQYFDGRIHHHVTEAHEYPLISQAS